MSSLAKIDDRTSIEGIYPRSAFEEDAARNSVGDAQIVFGVRVESGPDEHGRFRMVRAKQHVGEDVDSGGAVFLAPEHQTRYAGVLKSEAAGMQRAEGAGDSPAGEYAAFIERIVEAARRTSEPGPIGKNEERLKGFHGG